MIELYLSKVTETSESEQAGKLYARVDYKQSLSVQDMAHHMAEHNTAFSEGLITGILIDFVRCVREQVLNGNTVKIDNLAIFKATVEANALETLYDAQNDKVAQATIGNLAEGAKTGAAVKTIKLLAQSTGEFTRDELGNAGSTGNPGNSGNSGNSGTLASPTISGNTTFSESTQVSISGPDGAEIHYTTDGTVPTAASALYSEAFTLSATTTVKAIAIKDGQSSEVASRVFTKSSNDDGMGQD